MSTPNAVDLVERLEDKLEEIHVIMDEARGVLKQLKHEVPLINFDADFDPEAIEH